jgi:hypothetical protein
MLIDTDYNPKNSFFDAGNNYLSNPGAMEAIDFDDAVVVMKRYAISTMKDQELGMTLSKFGPLIRDQNIDEIRQLFEQVTQDLDL